MPNLKDYSTTAASNSAAAPDGFPEAMLAGDVNNSARTFCANTRGFAEELPWFNWGHSGTRASNTTFTIAADVTSIYTQYLPIKIADSSTLYGYVVSSSFSSPNTTVTVQLFSGNLSASMDGENIWVGIMPTSNFPIPKNILYQLPLFAAASGSSNAFTATYTPSPVTLVDGMILYFQANHDITGAATLNPNSIGATAIRKNGTTALSSGDIVTDQIVAVQYDSGNTIFQMLSPAATSSPTFPVVDTTELVKDPTTATKRMRIDVGAVSASTTRVLSMPDNDVDLADLATFLTADDVYDRLADHQYTSSNTAASSTTAIPFDDTIPQSSEGTQLTTVSITPKNASNILEIDFFCPLISTDSASKKATFSLFQDSTANALNTVTQEIAASSQPSFITLKHKMSAGTTSATTFKIRFGCDDTSTCYVLSNGGTEKYGTACNYSLTVKEYTVS